MVCDTKYLILGFRLRGSHNNFINLGDKVRIAPSPTGSTEGCIKVYMFSVEIFILIKEEVVYLSFRSSDESIKLYGYLITHIISIE